MLRYAKIVDLNEFQARKCGMTTVCAGHIPKIMNCLHIAQIDSQFNQKSYLKWNFLTVCLAELAIEWNVNIRMNALLWQQNVGGNTFFCGHLAI